MYPDYPYFAVAITRTCGSGGGSYIGKQLAKAFDIDLYDRKLLRLASEDSGISEELFARADENTRKTMLYRVSERVYDGSIIPPESGNFISDENLFNYQAKVLRELLNEESYICVGRAADWAQASGTVFAGAAGESGALRAGLLLAAILSDTVMFKSPTCTQRDIDIANRMSRIANVSLEELGQTIFSAATGEDKSAESIIRTDYKEFHIGGHNLAVSQITCLDSDRLMARKEEFLATMETIRKKNGLDIVLLMITNVLVEGSYLLYSGDTETIRQAFNITGEEKNCVFLSKIMSRKKQIIPSLSALWG